MASQESSKIKEEGSGRQVPEGPIHCLNNCGFFGSAATMNMCSKCFRELNANPPPFSSHMKPQQPALEQLNVKQPSIPLSAAPFFSSDNAPTVEAVAAVETAMGAGPSSSVEQEVEKQEQDEEEQTRKSKKRCYSCNRRVGLTGFKCRCGDLFCAQHRYSDMHDCSFDYKTAGRLAILKANPVVKAPKIDKI